MTNHVYFIKLGVSGGRNRENMSRPVLYSKWCPVPGKAGSCRLGLAAHSPILAGRQVLPLHSTAERDPSLVLQEH